jgi:hypothetical protein
MELQNAQHSTGPAHPAQAMHAQQPRTATDEQQILRTTLPRSRHELPRPGVQASYQTPHGPAAMAARAPRPAQDSETAPAQQDWRSSHHAACTQQATKRARKTLIQLTFNTLLVWSLCSSTQTMVQSAPSGSNTQSRHTFSQEPVTSAGLGSAL